MAVVIMYAVLNAMTKLAFNEGMHTTVFIVLRLLVAALFLSPIAYIKERFESALTVIFTVLIVSLLFGPYSSLMKRHEVRQAFIVFYF